MMSSHPLKSLLLFALATVVPWQSGLAEPSEKKLPLNVVFILADDLGWSDVTLYGTTTFYQTPHVERLARRGMTFTRAYSASPLCSPTRASLLTGLSPARHGITSPTCHVPQVILQATADDRTSPDQKAVPVKSVTRLSTDYQTLPKALKAAGYATAHFGKWHLGAAPYSPLEHGFDTDIPHHPGPGPAGSYVAPWKFKDFDHDPDIPEQHIEDRMAADASRWMEAHAAEPFFLNYWMFSVHAPFDAKRELIAKHRKRVDRNNPQRSPTYAAMIESMDDAIGTLLDTIDRLGIAERTIIIFASDNGGNMYNEVDGTTPTSNAPLRGGKATMYEGGVRGPAVVVWPGVVAGDSRSSSVIQSCDFYPTLLEMLQLQPQPNQSFDGISIVPALRGKPLHRDAIFTYFPHAPRVPDWLPPAVSIHRDDWKLIRVFHGGDGETHDYKLFNLDEDLGEARNLAGSRPDLVRELDSHIEQFLHDTQAVRPARNTNFDPDQFHPELIGQARRNKPGRGKRQTKPVAGWTPGRDCRLQLRQGALVITSSGRDPWLTFALPKLLPKGEYVLSITMASGGTGRGQFFWQEQSVTPKFHRDRSEMFTITHDDMPQQYHVRFKAAHSVPAVRLDPGQGAGRIRITSMRLLDASDDQPIHTWTFKP